MVTGDLTQDFNGKLWQCNVLKERSLYFTLTGRPIDILGDWKEGPALRYNPYDRQYKRERDLRGDAGKIGVYLRTGDSKIEIRNRIGPESNLSPSMF
jgi:hypothetical protein